MSIKRYEWVEYGEDPHYSGHEEKADGDYVLYTDHAAEVSRLEAEVMEQCRLNAMGAEREAKLRAERDSLRAQLEAAVCKCCDRPLTDDELKDAAGLSGEAQLTAQPDGVREAYEAWRDLAHLLDAGKHQNGYADWLGYRSQLEKATIRAVNADQALTAPAPAPLLRCGVCGEYHDEGGINPCKACRAKEAPAPAPCGACDIEWLCGIPSADPHTCEKAPAPAPVCVCGHSKADHAEKHGWECSEECTCLKYTPAPACKTCDYLDFYGNHPTDCPDCNAGEKP